VTGLNPTGAVITDAAGNPIAGAAQADLQLQIKVPTGLTVSSISATTPNGSTILNSGDIVSINLVTSEVVYVSGQPTLQLNDGNVAYYTGGSGTNSLSFSYNIAPQDNTPDLMVTGLILSSAARSNLPATIQDSAGVELSGPVQADLQLQIIGIDNSGPRP
jgi:hypothetical protein